MTASSAHAAGHTSSTSRAQPPRVYLITDRRATNGRPIESVVDLALGALAQVRMPASALAVQLREKDLGTRELLELAKRLRASTSAHGVRLFINDRADIAVAAGADGVHLGTGTLRPKDVRTVSASLQIAISAHSAPEIDRAAADGLVSFALLGPVFETPSKRGYGPALGPEVLRAAARGKLPVLAVGGINEDNLADCFAAGASGIACIRAIMTDPDPKAALLRILGAIERT